MAGGTEVETTELPLICACEADGLARGDSLVAEVTARIAAGTTELMPRVVTPANFLTELSRSLWWDFDPGVSIEGIFSDQWFGIRASDGAHTDPVLVPCDRVEHGLASIWLYYAAKQPPSPYVD